MNLEPASGVEFYNKNQYPVPNMAFNLHSVSSIGSCGPTVNFLPLSGSGQFDDLEVVYYFCLFCAMWTLWQLVKVLLEAQTQTLLRGKQCFLGSEE